ncbi:zf-HC2 domain-containing protein [Plantactinospora sp. KBS50]|uniref:zf-HC2 domain-containing protein n=1 Tax=Plantactinospora sp. KBS50 TaxID=2024580 RepID=UPI001E31430F|nr:zf-HC2 domain-containing protein [Plantactinospora sp. KBS50]
MSARIDGEDDPGERAPVDAHLHGCAACRRWQDDAVLVTRLARTGLVGPPPEVSEELLAALPLPRRRLGLPARWRGGAGLPRLRGLDVLLRAALGALGVVQVFLGLAQVSGFTLTSTGAHHGGDPYHLWHESAAWNVAIGAGFGWVALRRSRPTGLMPVLTAFVAVLGLLSVNDLVTGTVGVTRLLSHGLLVAGYVILAVLHRREPADPDSPPAERGTGGSRWRARFADEAAPARPPLRLVRRPVDGEARSRRAA